MHFLLTNWLICSLTIYGTYVLDVWYYSSSSVGRESALKAVNHRFKSHLRQHSFILLARITWLIFMVSASLSIAVVTIIHAWTSGIGMKTYMGTRLQNMWIKVMSELEDLVAPYSSLLYLSLSFCEWFPCDHTISNGAYVEIRAHIATGFITYYRGM